MANLEVKNPPEFTEEIYQVMEEDFITAALENTTKEKLLNNTIYNKKGLEAHKADTGKHIQAEERKKLSDLFENTRYQVRVTQNGWYTILEIASDNEAVLRGGHGLCGTVQIVTGFSWTLNVAMIVNFAVAYDYFNLQCINKTGNSEVIPKLRWVKYANSVALEFYYGGDTRGNPVDVTFLQWSSIDWSHNNLVKIRLSTETAIQILEEVDMREGTEFEKLTADTIKETDKKQFVTAEQKAKLDAALGNARGFQYIKEQGWYQILALEHEVASTVDGGGGFCVIVQIATVANYDPNMSCIAACTFAYNQLHIQVISLCGNQHVIPKIRWARYANSAVLELYYAGQAEGNWVVVTPLQWTTASTDAAKIRNLIKSPETPTRVVAELTLDGDKFDKLKREIEELKKSVSDGKNRVAAAITEKGQATAADASYAVMANNIGKIQTGYNTVDATAIREYILAPHTAYGPDGKMSGTMPNHNNAAVLYCSVSKYNHDNYALQSSQKGYFSGTTKFVAQNEIIAAAIGLTADKIVKGNIILGISGKG